MAAYYNENDPGAAAWLRDLSAAGLIPEGEVDERSIADVSPDDLVGFTQHHFFGGVGGWPLALRLAGWPDDRPVWSGSAPCQPISCAGKRGGELDERHLWPEFHRLIRECRPPVVLGEQVGSSGGLEWLDGISLDLEDLGYAVGSADLPAACCGSPHIRQRFFWVAESREREAQGRTIPDRAPRPRGSERLGDAHGAREGAVGGVSGGQGTERDGGAGGVGDAASYRQSQHERGERSGEEPRIENPSQPGGLGNALDPGPQGCGTGLRGGPDDRRGGEPVAPPGGWSDCRVIPCRDGKFRRISAQSSDFPLAHRVPSSVGPIQPILEGMGLDPKSVERLRRSAGKLLAQARRNRIVRLRGYGNAIVPQVAAFFIKAYLAQSV